MRKSAEQNIITFLRERPSEVFAAAQLQRMEFHNKNGTFASPKAISRRLQENAEGDKAILKVTYINGNAHYQIKKECVPKKQVVEVVNGVARIKYETIGTI